MFADQDWNLHLRDQHVNDKYFKDQHIWHLAPWPCRKIRRESDGKRWTSPNKRGTLGDLGRIHLHSGGFFSVLGPNIWGIERKKRAFYSRFFGFLCIFMANIWVFERVFSQLRYLMYQPNEGWGWNRLFSGGHSGRFWAKHVRWVCPHITPKKLH